MIRAIAFDWGGVFTRGTFDSGAVRDLASLFGTPEGAVATPYYPLMAEFERGAFDLDTFVARLLNAGTFAAAPEQARAAFLGAVRWREPMVALLRSIPREYTVGMLSNNVPALCDLVRRDTRMERIERFVFSNEIGVRKPDPAAFAALTESLGTRPEQTVFIDDNADNIVACEALGFTGLWVDEVEHFAERWRETLPGLPVPAELA